MFTVRIYLSYYHPHFPWWRRNPRETNHFATSIRRHQPQIGPRFGLGLKIFDTSTRNLMPSYEHNFPRTMYRTLFRLGQIIGKVELWNEILGFKNGFFWINFIGLVIVVSSPCFVNDSKLPVGRAIEIGINRGSGRGLWHGRSRLLAFPFPLDQLTIGCTSVLKIPCLIELCKF